eukprot:1240800-Rhodomonas_salina.1
MEALCDKLTEMDADINASNVRPTPSVGLTHASATYWAGTDSLCLLFALRSAPSTARESLLSHCC